MIKRFFKLSALFLTFIVVGALSAFFTLTFLVKSTKTVVVPELRGKNLAHALERLTGLGLNTKMKGYEFHGGIPQDFILYQEPEPGVEIKKGRDVWLVLSKGPESIVMPDLTAISYDEAKVFLDKAGLCENAVSKMFHEHFKKNLVVAHVPATGSRIIRGRCVDLLISEGQRPNVFKMPKLVGMSFDQAVLTLDKYHLKMGQVLYKPTNRKQYRVILVQEPEHGRPVNEKSTVHLTVNANKNDLFHVESSVFFHHRVSAGFLNKHVRIELTGNNSKKSLLVNYFNPGTDFWVLLPKSPGTEISLYEDWKLIKKESLWE
jgi:serine/threonine-protein kinase